MKRPSLASTMSCSPAVDAAGVRRSLVEGQVLNRAGDETSCPGVFAAGDVRSGSLKRVASAVGEGATAVRMIHQHLELFGGAN